MHEGSPGNVAFSLGGPPSDAGAEVFAAAAHVVEETIYQQSHTAVPMETRGIVIEWSRGSGDLMIWSATQAPHEVRAFCSRLLGIPEQQIRVVMRDTGGGFGQKVVPQREEACVMLAARKVPGALKWIEDRSENLHDRRPRPSRARHGADGVRRGRHPARRPPRPRAGRRRLPDAVADDGRLRGGSAVPGPVPGATGVVVGDADVLQHVWPHRVPGAVAVRVAVAREVLLDIAARRMDIDPVELRRRNMLRRDELPYANPNGMPYSDMTPAETFEHALEILDYDAFRREQAGRSRGGPLPRGRHLLLRRADDQRAGATSRRRGRRSASSRPAR